MGVLDILLHSFSPVSLMVALVFLLLIYLCSPFMFSQHKPEPPGPRPLPLLGNLLQLDAKRPDKTLLQFSKKYGSVFSVYIGSQKVVVLAGYKTVKEALVKYKEEFGERDPPRAIMDANLHHGITFGNGDSWREMRRFALMNLKDFGMGTKSCEDKIIEESHHIVQEFKKFNGEAFDLSQVISYAVCNIICSMIYGTRFQYDAPDFVYIINQTARGIRLLGSPAVQLYSFFPWIGKLFCSAQKEISSIYAANKSHHLKLLNRLKENLNPQMCSSIAEAFMLHQQQLEISGVTNNHFHSTNLLVTIMNLFNAGTETTAATLRWGILFMAKYPKIQARVQEELNRLIGGRQVQVEDRQRLPFTNAVIHETQRLANLVPLSLLHRTSQDVTFQGHFIKKGTTVIPLLTSVLYDESEWEKPNSFHPAHFLDKHGTFLKRDALLPFSAGLRMCPGESLARMELFLFFATLLQHFRFSPPPGVSEEELDLTPQGGGALHPFPHKLCAVSLM
ncbi:cytochrome P450 2K1-like [Melanotaenia boesemani]|uniref:cytochrome P450 2K1-like n=1 Tax=Melanotaenia boesemani TaxID=1250792 RepID=UPI001C03D24B|nr:cytochrome P450 2K1-like [Melanotaenia boesemani]